MDRRDFLQNSIFIPALGITLFYSLWGCSDDDSTSSTTSSDGTESEGTCTSVSADIKSNHGHTITPPTADEVTAGDAITLDLTIGNPGDTHTVSLTAENLASISTCGTVTVQSSTDSGTSIVAHSHSVTFTGSF